MEGPNVVIIVCDTLRKDVLGVYGGPAKTPNLSRLAKDSMVYENCIAPSPWTFPSHVSIFTGMYPGEHGVHEDRDVKIGGCIKLNEKLATPLLQEQLRSRGYATVGISNNVMVSRFTHFDRGFDFFANIDVDPWMASKEVAILRKYGPTIPIILGRLLKEGKAGDIPHYFREWMRIRAEAKARDFPLDKGSGETNRLLFNSKLQRRLFLFINLLEPHEPYRNENRKERWDHYAEVRGIGARSLERLWGSYVEEAEYLDGRIGELIEMLKGRGLYDDSLIIVTSDHGQAFNEHGFLYHSIYLYDEVVRVPLIIKYPRGRRFRKRKGYQSLVDLPRLVMDVVGGGDDSAITSEVAFSESFGDIHTAEFMPENYKSRAGRLARIYEKHRKAVYKGRFKLSVNGTDGAVEEFLKDGKPSDSSVHMKEFSDLCRELRDFAPDPGFKIPEIDGR
ncbi:MAG: sulfatase [Candidatus Micrarchaeota archaeon]|nr:sulfatase [Candidatus Micrarchaeota archaeon]